MRNAQELVNEVKECRNTLLLHAVKNNNNHSMFIREDYVNITVFVDKTLVTVKDDTYEYMLEQFHNLSMTNKVKADDDAELLELLETINKVIIHTDYKDKALHMSQQAIQKVIREAENEISNS